MKKYDYFDVKVQPLTFGTHSMYMYRYVYAYVFLSCLSYTVCICFSLNPFWLKEHLMHRLRNNCLEQKLFCFRFIYTDAEQDSIRCKVQ